MFDDSSASATGCVWKNGTRPPISGISLIFWMGILDDFMMMNLG